MHGVDDAVRLAMPGQLLSPRWGLRTDAKRPHFGLGDVFRVHDACCSAEGMIGDDYPGLLPGGPGLRPGLDYCCPRWGVRTDAERPRFGLGGVRSHLTRAQRA